MLYFLYNYC